MNLFDSVFNGMGRSRLYRNEVFPGLFPDETKQMLIHQWSADDREAYCGGEYTRGYYPRLVKDIA